MLLSRMRPLQSSARRIGHSRRVASISTSRVPSADHRFTISHVHCPSDKVQDFEKWARWLLPRCRNLEKDFGQESSHPRVPFCPLSLFDACCAFGRNVIVGCRYLNTSIARFLLWRVTSMCQAALDTHPATSGEERYWHRAYQRPSLYGSRNGKAGMGSRSTEAHMQSLRYSKP